jgi:hypothetical protein
MIMKQGLFRKHTAQFPISDLGHLDQPIEGVSKTLRAIIMEITVSHVDQKTQISSDERLFHSILPRAKSSDQQITFPKAHAATAVAMITGLIPFVLHHYGDTTKRWFSSTAMERSAGSKYDATTGTVITPNDKVVQDGLACLPWWMRDALTGIEDQTDPEPSRPVGRNSNVAGRRMSTGSQVTFSKNMETTHNYDPQDIMNNTSKDKDDVSESSESSNDETSSGESTTGDSNKGQATGNSTSEEDSGQGSGNGSGNSSGSINSDSNTAAIQKILSKNPEMLQKLINNTKAKGKTSKSKQPKSSRATKITPIKPKKAGSREKGSGRNS